MPRLLDLSWRTCCNCPDSICPQAWTRHWSRSCSHSSSCQCPAPSGFHFVLNWVQVAVLIPSLKLEHVNLSPWYSHRITCTLHMHIASHHNLSLRLIHKFFFLLPMNVDKTSIKTFLSPEIFAMLSDHTYSAKCSRCEVCPDCGLDPKIHYKKEEVPKLLTSKIFRHQFIQKTHFMIFQASLPLFSSMSLHVICGTHPTLCCSTWEGIKHAVLLEILDSKWADQHWMAPSISNFSWTKQESSALKKFW